MRGASRGAGGGTHAGRAGLAQPARPIGRWVATVVGLAAGATAGTAVTVAPRIAAAQQPVTIAGTVQNEAGVPLQAVTVAIPALGVGAQTNAQGRYTLSVPGARAAGQSVEMQARLVGYKAGTATVTLTAGATITRNFALVVNPLRLSEVVVTGSGTSTTREKLGTSVSTVSNEAITKATEANVVNALAAKATGVEITSSAGDPGAGSGIVIRGFKTIEGNGQPLFVVDGTPIDNSTVVSEFSDAEVSYANRALDINPNDIESVEILKGAAAASIYGLRAANGVVLITTKSGKAGQNRFTFSSVGTADEVNRTIELQQKFGRGTNGTTPTCGTNSLCQLRSWGAAIPNGTRTFDHAKDIFRTGAQFDNNLQMSGGDANRTFFLSAGWFDQQGIAKGPNSSLTRYSGRLKGTQNISPTLRIGGNILYTDLNQRALQKGNNLNGLMLGATRQPADFNPLPYKTPEGWQRAWSFPTVTRPGVYQIFDGPYWVANEQRNTSDVGRSIGNVSVDWTPRSWFSLAYSLGADYGNEARVVGLPPYSSGDANTGQMYQATNTNLIVDHNLLATFSKQVAKSVNGRVVFGQNLNHSNFRSLQVKGTGFIDPALFTLNNVISTNLQPQNFESTVNIAGYFTQVEADLWDQLYLSAGIRADQSSALAKENRTAYFPKGSVAWNAAKLLGLEDEKGILSYLKVRAAYGEVGRQPFAYQILTNLSAGAAAFAFGGGSTNTSQAGNPGLVYSSLQGNSNLKFERTGEMEAGFDFGLLSQRIDGSVAWYDATSRNVIFGISVPGSTGFTNQASNDARVRNRGWEVSLNGRILQRQNFDWDVGVNFTRNRNRVVTLGGSEFVGAVGGFGVSTVVAGQPIGTFYADDFVRCRKGDTYGGISADIPAATLTSLCASAPEGALYINANGFPEYDGRNKVIGDPNPDYLMGIRTGFSYKRRLRFSALLDVRRGGDVWNGTRLALQSYGTSIYTIDRGGQFTFGKDVPGMPSGPVVGPGAGRAVTVGENWWRTGLGNNFNGPTSQGVEDGGFTRLREISIAYTADNPWVRRHLRMSSVDLRLAGRNLALWTNYQGIDPETNLTGPLGAGRGIDYFNSPNTRSWVVNLQLNR